MIPNKALAIAETVPNFAISCNHIGDCHNCHQRTLIQLLMEIDAEIHSKAIGREL